MPTTKESTLKELLATYTREGTLYRALDDGRLECFACGHRCKIGEGRDGICKVRFNRGGKLYVPYGYAGGIQLDPIEKKPFFHALPGSTAMSFGMLGCDYHCAYCQNWITSQALRDPDAVSTPELVTPEDLIASAYRFGASVVTSTYNEPLITSEWAVEIFKAAKRYNFVTSYVSNGNGTPEVIDYITPWIDLYKVDLKGFNDRQYRTLGGTLQRVLDTIKLLYQKKIWIEIVTLVVPGFNDSDAELRDLAKFIVSVSPDIPWHVTAFHSDYKMSETNNTTAQSILHAREIGLSEGLHYVYAGNAPGRVGDSENTRCPSCNELLIERYGFRVKLNNLRDGHCPKCSLAIPGFWKKSA
ncbi:MAG: AmmeMemoRadiSam system radical SAM enzyme [Bacteroidota bacterium]